MIANLSYFMDREDWFEEKSCTCIDLTTAKVIKGKIVLNGDIRTYLKLKKENAKRKIYDLFHAGKFANAQEWQSLHWIDEAEGLLVPSHITKDDFDNMNDEEKTKIQLYFHSKKFESILAKDADDCFAEYDKKFCDPDEWSAMESLEKEEDRLKEKAKYRIKQNMEYYLNQLRDLKDSREGDKSKKQEARKANDHSPTIDKLNRIRDAITANMVGVIFHLQKTYPGIVILEDLDKEKLDKHFNQHNENISRRLEIKLYQKLQTLGKVPPHLKDIVALREEVRKENQELIGCERQEIIKSAIQKEEKNNSLSKKDKGEIKNIDNKKSEKWEPLKKELRDEIQKMAGKYKTCQLGAIVFVDESGTSTNCPFCEKSLSKNADISEDEKFKQHRYLCGEHKKACQFDSYYFVPEKDQERESKYFVKVNTQNKLQEMDILSEINDPDKVAAYNVAKKITKPSDIQELPEPKIEKQSEEENTSSYKNSHNKQGGTQKQNPHNKQKKTKPPINPDSPFAAMKDFVK